MKKYLLLLLVGYPFICDADISIDGEYAYYKQDQGSRQFFGVNLEKSFSTNIGIGFSLFGSVGTYELGEGVAHEGYGGPFISFTKSTSYGLELKGRFVVGYTDSDTQFTDLDVTLVSGQSYGFIQPRLSLSKAIHGDLRLALTGSVMHIDELNEQNPSIGVMANYKF